MARTLFDYVNAENIAGYWNDLDKTNDEQDGAFVTEELFPNESRLGTDITWYKGANGVVEVLKPSALDVRAVPRARIGLDRYTASLPFFKESKYVDENLRLQLNMLLASNNTTLIRQVVTNIFNDIVELVKAARLQRERMRTMALTTGVISTTGNGQAFDYDYGIPTSHKVNSTLGWSDPKAAIIAELQAAKDKIREDTGAIISRALINSKTMGYLRKNEEIKASLLQLTKGEGYISDQQIKTYILDILGISFVVDDQVAKVNGTNEKMVPDDTVSLFPSGDLGKTIMGTTPEQTDLLSNPMIANVQIVDTGVAITTTKQADPVQVDTKVSMICLPTFPTADSVYLIDTTKATSGS